LLGFKEQKTPSLGRALGRSSNFNRTPEFQSSAPEQGSWRVIVLRHGWTGCAAAVLLLAIRHRGHSALPQPGTGVHFVSITFKRIAGKKYVKFRGNNGQPFIRRTFISERQFGIAETVSQLGVSTTRVSERALGFLDRALIL